MRDIVFVAVALAFFGLCYLYVLGCDRIIGRDRSAASTGEPDQGVAASDETESVVTP